MKKYPKIIAALAAIALCAFSCTEKDVPKEPEQPVTPAAAFTARYVVPLTTGRDNGETDVVDAARAATKNVAELKPTLLQVVEAALASKVSSYVDTVETPGKTPTFFLPLAMARTEQNGGSKLAAADMNVSVEVSYGGVVADGHSRLVPQYMDVIWVDPAAVYPDRVMARIFMRDLGGFSVHRGETAMGLVQYLEAMDYERYVTRLSAAASTKYVGSFAASRDVQQRIDQGQIAEILAQ